MDTTDYSHLHDLCRFPFTELIHPSNLSFLTELQMTAPQHQETTPVAPGRVVGSLRNSTMRDCASVDTVSSGYYSCATPATDAAAPMAELQRLDSNVVRDLSALIVASTQPGAVERQTAMYCRQQSIPGLYNTPASSAAAAADSSVTDRELEELRVALNRPIRIPPTKYTCHICYQPGHYIDDCPTRVGAGKSELTPYQGPKKCYGEFQCGRCKRKWSSCSSYSDTGQKCKKCLVVVYPRKQLPLDKARDLGLVSAQALLALNMSGGGRSTPQSTIDGSVGSPLPPRRWSHAVD